MNRKGFTLVELLGVVVILSIIMLIAIPNITSTLDRNKKDSYIADAKKFVSIVEYEIRKGNVERPVDETPVKVTLDSLKTSDVEKDPDGNLYDTTNSYVTISKINKELVFQVQLVVKKSDGKYKGLILVPVDNLEGDTRYDNYRGSIDLGN